MFKRLVSHEKSKGEGEAVEELKTHLKPWFQRVVWGILGSSHDNKHYHFPRNEKKPAAESQV